MVDFTDSINSDFSNASGAGKGYEVPNYNVIDTPIVIGRSDQGVLVHEVVTDLLNPSSWVNGKEGTGDFKSDAVTFYNSDDFNNKYGSDYVTLDQYKLDSDGIQGARQSMGNDTPIVEAADLMHMRLGEVEKDLSEYQNKFDAENSINVPLASP